MNDINTHVCLMICLPRIFSVFKLHYSKMGSHLEVTFPSVFLWLLTTCTHVEKNFKRKGSLPSDLVQSCLGTSTWNTPLHYSRPLTSVQVGDPRGSKSKREMRLYATGPRSVSPKQADTFSHISTSILSQRWNTRSIEAVDLPGEDLWIPVRHSIRRISLKPWL